MKSGLFLLSSVIFISSFAIAQRPNVKIGMSVEEFDKALPGLVPKEQTYNEMLHENSVIHGCNGNWSYQFSKSQLSEADYWVSGHALHVGFSDYNEENSKSEFSRLNLVTEKHLKDYTARYGPPHQTNVENSEYIDPAKNNVSHDIKVYSWTFGNVSIKINFMFHGEAPPSADQFVMNAPMTQFYYGIHLEHKEVDFQKELIPPVLDSKLPFQLGMKVYDFAKKRPELFPKGVHYDGAYTLKNKWNGLAGSWHFSFDESKLSGISFSAYFQERDEVNEKNFKKCLAATRKMISAYTETNGKPKTLKEGDLMFKDPSTQRHWGYEVLEAEWKQNIKIRFKFHGGKGQYYFSVVTSESD